MQPSTGSMLATKLTRLATAVGTCVIGIAGPVKSNEAFPYANVTISYNVSAEQNRWDEHLQKFRTSQDQYNGSIVLSRMRVDGKQKLVVSYSSSLAGGCDVDGRFNSLNPMLRVGSKETGSVRCSNPAKPRYRGAMNYSTSSTFENNTLSFRSNLKLFERDYDDNSLVGENGQDVTEQIDATIVLDGDNCRVVNAIYRAKGQSFRSKSHRAAFGKGDGASCSVNR